MPDLDWFSFATGGFVVAAFAWAAHFIDRALKQRRYREAVDQTHRTATFWGNALNRYMFDYSDDGKP